MNGTIFKQSLDPGINIIMCLVNDVLVVLQHPKSIVDTEMIREIHVKPESDRGHLLTIIVQKRDMTVTAGILVIATIETDAIEIEIMATEIDVVTAVHPTGTRDAVVTVEIVIGLAEIGIALIVIVKKTTELRLILISNKRKISQLTKDPKHLASNQPPTKNYFGMDSSGCLAIGN
jgi:hypothetical protein